jgi:hypothetical protein
MHVAFPSRRRFLVRVLLYSMVLLVGFYMFLSNSSRPDGLVLGLLGMGTGALSFYLLFTRLQDPWAAVLYALRPMNRISQLIAEWPGNPSHLEPNTQQASLQQFLTEKLPDIRIGERRTPAGEEAALEVGEELLVYFSRPIVQRQDLEALLAVTARLRRPLQEEALLLVFASRLDTSWRNELLRQLRRTRVLIQRS